MRTYVLYYRQPKSAANNPDIAHWTNEKYTFLDSDGGSASQRAGRFLSHEVVLRNGMSYARQGIRLVQKHPYQLLQSPYPREQIPVVKENPEASNTE